MLKNINNFIIFNSIISIILLTSCSTNKNIDTSSDDIVKLVLGNFEHDFRYCVSIDSTNKQANIFEFNFTILPSGMVFNPVIKQLEPSTHQENSKTINCLKHVLLNIYFPPVKEVKAVNINRQLEFK